MSGLDRILDTRPLRTSTDFRRLWWTGAIVSMGGQFTVVAVLFQMWQLTGSAVAVGAVGLSQALSMVITGLIGGTLADAVDRRTLALVANALQLSAVVLLALHGLAGTGSQWVLLALVALNAAGGGLGAPARRTFVPRLLPTDLVRAGVALLNLNFQVAMLLGPALAGVLVAQWGVSACYLLDAAAFTAVLYGVARLPSMRPDGQTGRPGARAIWHGWRFIAASPVLRGALLTDALATLMAMPIGLFPLINEERFGGDPRTLGLLFTALAVGGITAGAASGALTRAARPGTVLLAAAAVWGLALAGLGLASAPWQALCCLAVAGAADTTSVITRAAIVQLATPDSHRGRVSGVEHIVGAGGPELGNFRAGLVAEATTAAIAACAGGLLCVAGIAWLALTNPQLRRFDTPQPQQS
ncbi:Predicted arabinose efflux permease, MFS family [Saccharopolyspora antimicrobica]|uniref:MFS family arabinose efflux permease n=1 Tax=Saccharopolyspora antimicrobica TaxID=455193 RepID=A0A1I4RGQ8_9PSEU|nr:MFS transporter [Saccharopolyspora antimicrobica]RKT88015.1 putative MFS family arabinose efflux permease [Saccharopolyspora antimicrobica]SFM51462.1 Predicted arabinose efflux permease, MFS family [Saccharopolyspora antimicrobica]